MRRSLFIWLAGALAYGGFLAWYDGLSGPLRPDEVDRYMKAVERVHVYGDNDAIKARLRSFLEADDGREFFMVNLLRYRATPQPFEGMRAGETSREAMQRYSGAFMPAILSRAGWLVSGGQAAVADLERWGVQPDADWAIYGLVRYRSRRDLAEVISDPAFDNVHPYKFAAIEATRAFPVSPAIMLLSPRLVVALVILVLALLAQLMLIGLVRKT
jgi:hypothetical protein